VNVVLSVMRSQVADGVRAGPASAVQLAESAASFARKLTADVDVVNTAIDEYPPAAAPVSRMSVVSCVALTAV